MVEKSFMVQKEIFGMNIFDICYTSGTRRYHETIYKFLIWKHCSLQ